ncbi:hypothetical protein [Paraburkholderia caballeronis]|uniref:hypothetical protein n=1 Tax=Paraburkholderia caballeronis TaxID=416943 RepID=UPI0010667FEA|nr:hypothetical protein [Paraburkholderia caballeronis]
MSRDDCDEKIMRGAGSQAVFLATVVAASISGATALLFVTMAWVVRGFKKQNAARDGKTKSGNTTWT